MFLEFMAHVQSLIKCPYCNARSYTVRMNDKVWCASCTNVLSFTCKCDKEVEVTPDDEVIVGGSLCASCPDCGTITPLHHGGQREVS